MNVIELLLILGGSSILSFVTALIKTIKDARKDTAEVTIKDATGVTIEVKDIKPEDVEKIIDMLQTISEKENTKPKVNGLLT